MSKKILRLPEVRERLGVGRTTLYERFVRTGRLRPVQIGPRAIGFVEGDVDAIIDELVEGNLLIRYWAATVLIGEKRRCITLVRTV